jgi:hypothetical protein
MTDAAICCAFHMIKEISRDHAAPGARAPRASARTASRSPRAT